MTSSTSRRMGEPGPSDLGGRAGHLCHRRRRPHRHGPMSGSLKDFSATDLGGFAIKGALEKAGITGDQVDYVIMGQVLQAGCGQMTARQAAVKAASRWTSRRSPINKVCLSGINAIALADQLIRAGEFEVVVAGGHGVDDQRPAPAREEPRGLQVRHRQDARPHGLRRSVRRLHRPGHGQPHRVGQHRRPRVHPRGAGRLLGSQPPERRQGVEGRPTSTTRSSGADPAAQGRPDRVQGRRGHPRGHHRRVAGRAAPGLRARTARSPPAPPRRSPTGPARSSS
jgi:hypothetical protein